MTFYTQLCYNMITFELILNRDLIFSLKARNIFTNILLIPLRPHVPPGAVCVTSPFLQFGIWFTMCHDVPHVPRPYSCCAIYGAPCATRCRMCHVCILAVRYMVHYVPRCAACATRIFLQCGILSAMCHDVPYVPRPYGCIAVYSAPCATMCRMCHIPMAAMRYIQTSPKCR